MKEETVKKIARLEVLREKPLEVGFVWGQMLEMAELQQDILKELEGVNNSY